MNEDKPIPYTPTMTIAERLESAFMRGFRDGVSGAMGPINTSDVKSAYTEGHKLGTKQLNSARIKAKRYSIRATKED